MKRIVKQVFGLAMVVTAYVALFSVHWALGLAMLIGHVGFETMDYLERRELVQQLMDARSILEDLDNIEEPPAREGNC